MRNVKLKEALMVIVTSMVLLSMFTGCSALSSYLKNVKGKLIGESFVVSVYDDWGNNTANISGEHVSIGNYEGKATYDSEGNKISKFDSQVLEITIDGNQLLHVGSTMIFEEVGVDKLVDFNNGVGTDDFTNIDVTGSGGFIPMDRLLNKAKHMIGKGKTIVISSQMGIPLMVYQGDKVFVEVPEDLPKMTRITIDGKSLYLHRVEYQIYDSNMLN